MMKKDWLTICMIAVLLCIAAVLATQTSALQVYVVSLRRDEASRARVKARAPGVRFVDAVDARRLAPGGTLGREERACFRSHVRAWRLVAARGDEFALVFEDTADLRLPSAWSGIRTAVAACPPDWDVVFLGTKSPLLDAECVARGGRCSVKRVVAGDASGLHAIALSGAGARKLLAAWERQGSRTPSGAAACPVDVWVSRQPGLSAFWVDPALVKLVTPRNK
jgi:hypothetical protein